MDKEFTKKVYKVYYKTSRYNDVYMFTGMLFLFSKVAHEACFQKVARLLMAIWRWLEGRGEEAMRSSYVVNITFGIISRLYSNEIINVAEYLVN